jgi:hypothetical protein
MHRLCSAQISLANNLNNSSVASSPKKRKTSSSQAAQPRCDSQRRTTPPFVLTYDIPRGIIQAVLASVNILFMLTVMWVVLRLYFNVNQLTLFLDFPGRFRSDSSLRLSSASEWERHFLGDTTLILSIHIERMASGLGFFHACTRGCYRHLIHCGGLRGAILLLFDKYIRSARRACMSPAPFTHQL